MEHIASFSGGKDSTATIILAHKHNEPLDEIVFSEVMFDKETSGELPEHIDFIKNKAFPLFESWGYKCTILHSGFTFMDNFNTAHMGNGKHPERKGLYLGFPYVQGCPLNRKAKVQPIKKYLNGIKDKVQYVGIAVDEQTRLERMKKRKTNEVSLLEKYGYTEEMALNLCKQYDLLSPIYKYARRGGCWFCPNMGIAELKNLRENHRELWEKIIELEKIAGQGQYIGNIFNTMKKTSITELEKRFSLQEKQMTIWDFIKQ